MLITFKDTQVTYDAFQTAITRHLKMDALVQGVYDKDINGQFQGCHIGCTLHDFGVNTNNHAAYETLFGIPQVIARLCDRIHEGLPTEETPVFFAAFRDAVKPNQDLNMVWARFALWMLVGKDNPYRLKQHESVADTIEQVYQNWIATGEVFAVSAAAAVAAADAASAFAAADAAAVVAASAFAAADAAAVVAASGFAAADAAASAQKGFWIAASKKLIKLISNAPILA